MFLTQKYNDIDSGFLWAEDVFEYVENNDITVVLIEYVHEFHWRDSETARIIDLLDSYLED